MGQTSTTMTHAGGDVIPVKHVDQQNMQASTSEFYCIQPGDDVKGTTTFYKDDFSNGSCADLAQKYPESQKTNNNGVYWTLKDPDNSKLGCYFHTSDYRVPDLCTKVTMHGKDADTVESKGPASETDLCNSSTRNCPKFD